MNVRLEWSAVRTGASLGVAVSLATLILVEVVDASVGIGRRSNWVFLFYAIVLAGLVAGGRLAARQRPDAPGLHGLAAAMAAFAVAAAHGTAARLLAGTGPDPVALAFNALMAASAGILGGLLVAPGPRPATRAAEPGAPPGTDPPAEPPGGS